MNPAPIRRTNEGREDAEQQQQTRARLSRGVITQAVSCCKSDLLRLCTSTSRRSPQQSSNSPSGKTSDVYMHTVLPVMDKDTEKV